MASSQASCLLCLSKNKNTINFYSDAGKELNIINILSSHFWFNLEEINTHPNICYECLNKIESFHEFYESVQIAHNKFETVFVKIENELDLEENVETYKSEQVPHDNIKIENDLDIETYQWAQVSHDKIQIKNIQDDQDDESSNASVCELPNINSIDTENGDESCNAKIMCASKRAKIFTDTEMQNFIDNAPDIMWLDVKVACIFAICGACRTYELPSIKIGDIKRYDDMYYVKVTDTKTGPPSRFAITGSFLNIVRRYESLRPGHARNDRFFLNYQKGKCTVQAIGKNKFYKMPERIAKYLHLPNPELYTVHSFRRSSITIHANRGATIEAMKRHKSRNGLRKVH